MKLIYAKSGEEVILGLTVGFGSEYPELAAKATGEVIEIVEGECYRERQQREADEQGVPR